MFLINFIIIIICTILASIYLKWHQMKLFWVKKGIPNCEVHPIFGSLSFLQKLHVNTWCLNIYKQYPFPYVGIWVFWRPGLVVNCPEIAHNILVKDADNFRNRLLGTGKSDELGCQNLLTANDPLWTLIRRSLSPTFTPAKLRSWHKLYTTKSKDLVERIKSDNINGINNNLKPLFADLSTDIIGESAFGIKCEATKNSTGHLREMTKDFEKYSMYRGFQWSLIFFFPELAGLLRCTFWPRHTMLYFKQVFNMIVKQRGGYEMKIHENKDLVDALRKMKQNAEKSQEDLDEVVMVANAMILLQGGYDTSSTSLAYTIYELAYHSQYQEILHKELMESINKKDNSELDANDLAELPYFNAVIKEILRKYLPMGWLDRVATHDYKIDDKLTLPAGTAVLININGIHHDPKHFPDPNQFKPERFLPENEKNIVPYTYLPFGDGPRFCIGKRFGLSTMRYALAALIENFVFKPLPNMPLPNDTTFDKRSMFLQPGEVLSVEFVLRN